MKRILFLFCALAVLATSFASISVEAPPKKANEIFLPIGKTGNKISLQKLSEISIKNFEQLSGRKMKFFDRMSFKLGQHKLRQNINDDGTLNNKRITKIANKVDGTDGFHIGGFALGFLLGLIGVLIAYIINDDKKRNRVKWSWIGLAAIVALALLRAVLL